MTKVSKVPAVDAFHSNKKPVLTDTEECHCSTTSITPNVTGPKAEAEYTSLIGRTDSTAKIIYYTHTTESKPRNNGGKEVVTM